MIRLKDSYAAGQSPVVPELYRVRNELARGVESGLSCLMDEHKAGKPLSVGFVEIAAGRLTALHLVEVEIEQAETAAAKRTEPKPQD